MIIYEKMMKCVIFPQFSSETFFLIHNFMPIIKKLYPKQ